MKSDETHRVAFCFRLPSVYTHSGVRWANTAPSEAPSNFWLCKWTFRIGEFHQPQLKIAVLNTVQSMVGSNCFLSVISWIRRCEIRRYEGPTVFLEKNPHLSGPMKCKAVSFKGQLYIFTRDYTFSTREFSTTEKDSIVWQYHNLFNPLVEDT